MRRAILALSVMAILVISAPLYAAPTKGTVELSPFMGYTWFDDDLSIDDAPTFGLRFGYFLSDQWEAELAGYFVSSEYKGGDDVNIFSSDLDILYNFQGYGQWLPYLGAGLGVARFDPQEGGADYEFTGNVGGGIRYFVTEDVAIRGDIREIHLFDDSDWNFMATLGLSLYFGGETSGMESTTPVEKPSPAKAQQPTPPPAPVPAPLDSDNDGVTDAKDRCSGTPAGVTVDEKGCPIDTDGDGVWDFKDKCPATVGGAKVDVNGCELDSDGDGVLDSRDKCPKTTTGAKVDSLGCELDTDGDGVVDSRDECSGTPKGVSVNSRGCRIDTDGDGVWDEDDKCPTTPSGVPVDGDGCNIKKISIKLEAEFDTGRAEIREESFPEVNKVGEFMVKYPSTKAVIEGHTDSVGSSVSNITLSQRRADAVREYLIKNFEIDPSRLMAKGYGEDKPVADNSTPEGRQMNRRIEAVIETSVKQ
ncbi:MAG: outer membrane beta-barrel domain-containing protein [Deltaproteobacteria bacterium]|nr:MAG: outer membrane beta-barrel domain-containing protein [Deltaproteobacteria bacterium]